MRPPAGHPSASRVARRVGPRQARGGALRAALALGAALLAAGCDDEHPTTTDTTPPAAVADLTGVATSPTQILLTWTAPGDDGAVGTAESYDLRYRSTPFDAHAWDSLSAATGEPEPGPAGTEASCLVAGLAPETPYYLALRATDEAGNVSAISNIVALSTPAATRTWVVDPAGGGDFLTIGAALAAAGDGDTLRLRAGTYDEAVTIAGRSLTLIGEGPELTILDHDCSAAGELLLAVSQADVSIQRVYLRTPHIDCPNAIMLTNSRVTISDCALIECGLTCTGGDLTLTGCTVHATPYSDCDALVPLVQILGGTAWLARNIITLGSHHGVACSQDAAVTFLCNDSYGHSGADYSGCSDPTGDDGNISADPRFVDAARGDFRLRPDSPCVGSTIGCGRMGAFPVAE